MNHSKHTRLQPSELTSAIPNGATLYGPDEEWIGTRAHVHGRREINQVIVDVVGFLGIGAKPLAINSRELDFMRDESGIVHALTTWPKGQLEALPEQHH